MADKDGVKVVQEVVKSAKNNGGFFEYICLNPQTGKDENKNSIRSSNLTASIGRTIDLNDNSGKY